MRYVREPVFLVFLPQFSSRVCSDQIGIFFYLLLTCSRNISAIEEVGSICTSSWLRFSHDQSSSFPLTTQIRLISRLRYVLLSFIMLLISDADLSIEVLLFYLFTGCYINLPWLSVCLHRQKLSSISRDTLESIEVQSHGLGLSSEKPSCWPREEHRRVKPPTSCLQSGKAHLSHVTLT